jgi:hypothetical protein
LFPHPNPRISLGVANEIEAMLCSTHEDIDSIAGFEKSNLPGLIASDERYDNYLRFFSLEIVHCGKTIAR